MDHPEINAALRALQAAARRSAVARRMVGDVEQSLLQTVVDAAVALFDAEASSIALHEPDPDRLEFRVASGEHGSGVIGLSVPVSKGIVGYVYSTGQAIALSDVLSDPRFDQATAQRTGYVPRSIAAVPLVDGTSTIGVLQVLDKRSTPAFTLKDMELMAVFARQAATAIEATKVQRDGARLLRATLQSVGELDEADLDALVANAAQALDGDESEPFWQLVDLVSRLRGLSDDQLRLVADILEVVGRSAARSPRRL